MEPGRPDPDALLAATQAEDQAAARGKLKIFFGANAGVGKTYAMLEDAQRQRAESVDVAIGVVETHGRAETEKLLAGLEMLPRKDAPYRGITLSEFDLETAIKRRPAIILVDELAHTNAPGTWHAKRWQDVRELLDAGIDVYTTLNVQHLESVGDLVAQLTSVAVRETVPDTIFDQADDVELVDITPDDLLQRLREGKVYIPAQAARALESFFTKGHLIALRELALRRMADRVEGQRESFRLTSAPGETSPLTERLLVAVSPSPFAPRVVRAARRLADRLHAAWIAAYVDTPGAGSPSAETRDRLFDTLRLADGLGAETVTLTGDNPAKEVLRLARQRGVNRIVVGKPGRPRWRDRLGHSFVDDLVRNDAGIDVYVVRDQVEEVVRRQDRPTPRRRNWWRYLGAVAVVALCTLVAWPITRYFYETSSAMLYVLGTVVVALLFGRGPSVLASVLGVACFDFFFIPPFGTVGVADFRYLFTFLVILVVGNVIAALALQAERQAQIARKQEQRTRAVYQLTRELTSATTLESLIVTVERNLTSLFGTEIVVLLPNRERQLAVPPGGGGQRFAQNWRMPVAQWVLEHGKMAGLGTDTLSSGDSLFVPLNGERGTVGVLGIRAKDRRLPDEPEQMLLLETLARHAALALEVRNLMREATEAQIQAEAERFQSTLLASVSHDLRTPLASITGAASTLVDEGDALATGARRELAATIQQETTRLNHLVTNLLQVTRLESGALRPTRDWQSAQELVGVVLERTEAALAGRPVAVNIAPDLPLLFVDAVLVEQVLLNLLDNVAKHTPPGTPVEIAGRVDEINIVLTVADRGLGLPHGEEARVFEKFYRGTSKAMPLGAGLGLAIVRGFVEAHGGQVRAYNGPHGGAVFELRFPLATPPRIEDDEADSAEPGTPAKEGSA